MKEKIKIVLAISLTLFITCFNITRASASELDNIIVSTDLFQTHVDDMFENRDATEVIDANGNDIKTVFFEENFENYSIKDYDGIKLYMDENVFKSSVEKNETISFTRSPYVNQTASKSYTFKPDFGGTITYSINGTFVWDRATYKITSIGNTHLYVNPSLPEGWQTEIISMSTNKKISSDGYSATFSAIFTLRAKLVYNYIPLEQEDLHFSNSFTAYPDA